MFSLPQDILNIFTCSRSPVFVSKLMKHYWIRMQISAGGPVTLSMTADLFLDFFIFSTIIFWFHSLKANVLLMFVHLWKINDCPTNCVIYTKTIKSFGLMDSNQQVYSFQCNKLIDLYQNIQTFRSHTTNRPLIFVQQDVLTKTFRSSDLIDSSQYRPFILPNNFCNSKIYEIILPQRLQSKGYPFLFLQCDTNFVTPSGFKDFNAQAIRFCPTTCMITKQLDFPTSLTSDQQATVFEQQIV